MGEEEEGGGGGGRSKTATEEKKLRTIPPAPQGLLLVTLRQSISSNDDSICGLGGRNAWLPGTRLGSAKYVSCFRVKPASFFPNVSRGASQVLPHLPVLVASLLALQARLLAAAANAPTPSTSHPSGTTPPVPVGPLPDMPPALPKGGGDGSTVGPAPRTAESAVLTDYPEVALEAIYHCLGSLAFRLASCGPRREQVRTGKEGGKGEGRDGILCDPAH